jgi:hypothetical protein
MNAAGTDEITKQSGGDAVRKGPGLGAKFRAGVGGAVALTAVHELARRLRGDAPRMDVLGARALEKLCGALGLGTPRGRPLYLTALTGDILSNAAFYAGCLSSGSRRPRLRSLLSGAAAGYAAYKLPPLLGLGRSPRSRRRSNRVMTVAWYAIGGLVAATLYARRRP